MPSAPRYPVYLFNIPSFGQTYESVPPMMLEGPDNTITPLGNLIPAPDKDDEPR